MSKTEQDIPFISRKDAKEQSATALLKGFFASLRDKSLRPEAPQLRE